MSIGQLKKADNAGRKFGADPWYWFIKVQDALSGTEDYWLATEEEAQRFEARASKDLGNSEAGTPGVVSRVSNADPSFGAARHYHELSVLLPGGEVVFWSLTDADVARLQERAAKNPEDVTSSRESWLADLFD